MKKTISLLILGSIFNINCMSLHPVVLDGERPQKDQTRSLLKREWFLKKRLPHDSSIQSLTFDKEGRVLASGGGSFIKLWDPDELKLRAILRTCIARGDINALAFNEKKELASGSEDGIVRLWDTDATHEQAQLFDDSPVNTVTFCSDTIIASGSDHTSLWDTRTKKETDILGPHGRINATAFSEDGQSLVSGAIDETITIWDMRTKTPRLIIPSIKPARWPKWLFTLILLPNGDILASNIDRIALLSSTTGTLLKKFYPDRRDQAFTHHVTSMALNENLLITGSNDKMVHLWKLRDKAETDYFERTLEGHTEWINTIALDKGRKMLASGGCDKIVHIWQPE